VNNTPCEICLNADLFCKALSFSSKTEYDILLYKNNEDTMHVELSNAKGSKGEFDNHFVIPLLEMEYEEFNVSNVEHDADIILNAKQFVELVNQMSNFSEEVTDIDIEANETKVVISTKGTSCGEFTSTIETENMIEYAITEGVSIEITFSIKSVKLCLTNKLSNNVNLSISNSKPMKLLYDLGDESNLVFHIANKIDC
jgi:hypothetical protein